MEWLAVHLEQDFLTPNPGLILMPCDAFHKFRGLGAPWPLGSLEVSSQQVVFKVCGSVLEPHNYLPGEQVPD